MRRLLGLVLSALLLAGVLAGCADDPAPAASESSSKGSTGEGVDFELVEMITETGAGGETEAEAVPLADDAAVEEFVSQFSSEAMATRVRDAVERTDVADGMLLHAAIVAIGCDSPLDVYVTSVDQGVVITAQEVPSPVPECFAPMTTVALVLVPVSAVS